MRWLLSWLCYWIGHGFYLLGERVPDEHEGLGEFLARQYQRFMRYAIRAQGDSERGPWRRWEDPNHD